MKFRKKPVVIDAVQYMGVNATEVLMFAQNSVLDPNTNKIVIRTLEGDVTADVGDWVIRGVKGEHYPCKPDIFEATYEPC